MSITIPDEVLRVHSEQGVRTEIALALYARDIFTRKQACEFLNRGELEFLDLLASRGIPARYDADDFREDTETLGQIVMKDT